MANAPGGDSPPVPTEITLHQPRGPLEVVFASGRRFEFTAEFLRVHSPSAEVQGHGPGQGTLQQGKREVAIVGIEPVGNYAIKIVFSDGHDTGLFSWGLLHQYGLDRDTMWARYLQRLEAAGGSREPAR